MIPRLDKTTPTTSTPVAAAQPAGVPAEAGPVMARDAYKGPSATVQTGGVGKTLLGHLPYFLRTPLSIVASTVGITVKRIKEAIAPSAAPAEPKGGPLEKAQYVFAGIERNFGIPGQKDMFRSKLGENFRYAEAWPHGQGIGAALDLAQVTGEYKRVDDLMEGLQHYEMNGAYSPSAHPLPGMGRFYDDNAWIGLDFMQAYQQTGNKDYLNHAQDLFKFIEQGVHKDGGLYWVEKESRMSRNTCSNGPAIEYALRLYMATKDEKYLQFAQGLDQFMNSKLRSPEGLYWDNLGDDGGLSKDIYSYNQGTPIGADVLFYRVTKDPKYLERAKQTADAALKHFGEGDRLWKQAPSFNAIFLRNLMALDQVVPDPRYRQVLEGYTNRLWTEARDPKTGLFDQGGVGSYEKGANYLDQSGIAQLFALQAWPKDKLIDVA